MLVSDIAVAKPRYQMLRDNIKTGRRRQVSRKWASGTRHYVALVALVTLVALRSTCSTVASLCSTSSTSSTVARTSWMQSTRPADIPQIRKWASGIIWDLGNELQYLSCPPNHLPMKICISWHGGNKIWIECWDIKRVRRKWGWVWHHLGSRKWAPQNHLSMKFCKSPISWIWKQNWIFRYEEGKRTKMGLRLASSGI